MGGAKIFLNKIKRAIVEIRGGLFFSRGLGEMSFNFFQKFRFFLET